MTIRSLLGTATAAFVAVLSCASCSSSSNGARDCSSVGAVNGSCDAITNDIRAHNPPPGVCGPPVKSASFVNACASLQTCLQCLGIDGGV